MPFSLDPVVGLALGRIGVGVLALTQPEEAARRFRLGAGSSGQLTYMTRMFGSREIALGALTLVSSGATRRRLVVVGLGVDAADAYASIRGLRDGSLSTTTSAFLTGPAVGGVLAGLSAVRRSRRLARAEKRSA